MAKCPRKVTRVISFTWMLEKYATCHRVGTDKMPKETPLDELKTLLPVQKF